MSLESVLQLRFSVRQLFGGDASVRPLGIQGIEQPVTTSLRMARSVTGRLSLISSVCVRQGHFNLTLRAASHESLSELEFLAKLTNMECGELA